ncbi:Fanconi anemia group B protein-like [Ptychodera flava]|uniref:Fanconi anemia group B protein-like n=1 Tax=Ptychodera flava TaxID=63121 RepID=UPI00396A8EED
MATDDKDITLLAYGGDVLRISITTAGGILAAPFEFDRSLQEFNERDASGIEWSLPGVNLVLVGSKTVTENTTGLKLPCVLLEAVKHNVDSMNKRIYLLLLLSFERREFVPVGKFRHSENLQKVKYIELLDGPLLCWTAGKSLHYSSYPIQDGAMHINTVPLSKPFSFFVGVIANNRLVAMGAREVGESDAMETEEVFDKSRKGVIWDHEWIALSFDLRGHKGQGDCDLYLDGTDFVPHAYAGIVSSVKVFSHHDQYELDYGLSKKTCHKNQTIVASTQGQLLLFRDGQLLKCHPLPFTDACDIIIVTVSSHQLVLVKSLTKKCCAIWEDSFEIAKTWETVDSILVDDFVHSGNDQILLLSATSSTPNPCRTFVLTDLQLCHITDKDSHSDIGKVTVEDTESSSNLWKAIQALESRLQVTQASVRESELLQEQKSRMIRKTCQSLLKMASGDPKWDSTSQENQGSLVCLYDGTNPSTRQRSRLAEVKCQGSKFTSKAVDVKCSWQHIVEDSWVIGVTLENTGDRNISDLSMSLISNGNRFQVCESTSVSSFPSFKEGPSMGNMSTSEAQPNKRFKAEMQSHAMLYPGNQTDVVAVTTLPQLGSDAQCSCRLILHQFLRETDSKERGDGVTKVTCIGQALLTAADVLEGKFSLEYHKMPTMSESDCQLALKSLNAIQVSTHLHIHSKFTNLTPFPRVLQRLMGFQPLPGHLGYICCEGALSGVRVHPQEVAPNDVLLRLHTRNENQFILAVHAFYENLADDVEITPAIPSRAVKHAVQSALTDVHTELEQTIAGCKDLIKAARDERKADQIPRTDGSDNEDAQISAETQDKQKGEQIRKDLETERISLSTLPGRVVGADRYNVLVNELLQLKLQTDGNFQELASLER